MRNKGCPKHASGKRIGKKAAYSYISLFLVALLVLTASYSWFTRKSNVTINSEEMTLDTSNGLRVNDGENVSNHISVDDFVLDEASSLDGRNLYFPASGNYVAIDSLEKQKNMLFREATNGDKNKRFLYKTFTLHGDSDYTNVYIRGYNIAVSEPNGGNTLVEYNGSTEIIYENGKPVSQAIQKKCPIRVAFITDSSETPIMLDPSAVIKQHARNYNVVADTNDVGSPTIQKTQADAFATYYGMIGKPIVTIPKDKPVEVTMVAWLEGGLDDDGNSEAQKYAGKSISIDVEIESNWTDMDMVYFEDETLGDNGVKMQWISATDSADESKHCVVVMSYLESDTGFEKTVVMEEMEYVKHNNVDCCVKWRAPLPKNVKTNIYFYRLALNNNTIYNSWITRKGVNDSLNSTVTGWIGAKKLEEDRGTSTTYTAERGNGYGETSDMTERLSPCVGYWNGGGSTGGGTTTSSTSGGTQPTQPTTPLPTTVKAGIYLNIPESLNWIRNDLSNSGNYKMYAVFSNGTESEMTYDNGVCTVTNVSVPINTQLLAFKYHNYRNGTNKDTITADPYTFTDSRNVTYEVTDYGKKAKKTS